MKIAFFEIEDWEKPYIDQKLRVHEITYSAEHLTEQDLPSLKETECLSVFIYSQLTKEILEKLPNLKLITTRSTGYDHIDLTYCREKNITVCNVPEYGTHTVAEHTFALILAISRKLLPSVARASKGDFSLDGLRGFDLYKKTLGIVGLGNIGTSVAQIGKGFGMDVLAYARHPDIELAKRIGFMYVDFDHLLTVSDIVTLHLPLTPQTTHIINIENVHTLKKGAVLINTARGGLIETEAILSGLQEGILSGVGIDVLEEECGIKEERELLAGKFLETCDLKTQLLNHVLLTRDDVIVTPHNAFNSNEALHTILDVTVENIVDFTGNHPRNLAGEANA